MVTRVKGGIVTDQMLKGKLRFFKITGAGSAFQYTVGTDTNGDGTGDPEVVIPDTESGQGSGGSIPYVEKIGVKQPVPNSVAEYTLTAILEKCTISMVRIISDTEIHIAIENTDNGWDTTSEGPFNFDTGLSEDSDAAANMTAALVQIGEIEKVPDTTNTGKTFSFSASPITVTEVAFQLV